jgi:hypothetical protein
VTPNQQIPVITNAPVQSPGSVVNPQGTVTPAVSGTAKNDTKPSTINGNTNPNQHVTTPGNTKIDNTDIDHTLPRGTQRVDGITVTPPKK